MRILFALNLALLFTHEMDAIRQKEWRMFAVLKDLPEQQAYTVFLALHIPLYAAVLYLLLSPAMPLGMLVVDVFLLAHTAIHFGFRNHRANGFGNTLSLLLIYGMGAASLTHLALVLLG